MHRERARTMNKMVGAPGRDGVSSRRLAACRSPCPGRRPPPRRAGQPRWRTPDHRSPPRRRTPLPLALSLSKHARSLLSRSKAEGAPCRAHPRPRPVALPQHRPPEHGAGGGSNTAVLYFAPYRWPAVRSPAGGAVDRQWGLRQHGPLRDHRRRLPAGPEQHDGPRRHQRRPPADHGTLGASVSRDVSHLAIVLLALYREMRPVPVLDPGDLKRGSAGGKQHRRAGLPIRRLEQPLGLPQRPPRRW